MNCLASVVKYIVFIFNTIFLLCGILLIVLGSIILSYINGIVTVARILPIFLIVIGCIVFVVAFFGCCGAIRENLCCLITYAIFLGILLCLQTALVIWLFEVHQSFLNSMSSLVDTSWQHNDAVQGFPMNGLQITFKCCGKQSYKDYLNEGKEVPISCCGSMNAVSCPASEYMSKPGCQPKFVDFWATYTNFIRYSGIPVLIIEFVAFIFACYLAHNVRRARGHSRVPTYQPS